MNQHEYGDPQRDGDRPRGRSHPERHSFRGRGGSKLVEAGLEASRNRGHGIVLVLGHPEFYPRFGFAAERARPLKSPFGGGDAWMATELAPGALKGVKGQVEYPPPFGLCE